MNAATQTDEMTKERDEEESQTNKQNEVDKKVLELLPSDTKEVTSEAATEAEETDEEDEDEDEVNHDEKKPKRYYFGYYDESEEEDPNFEYVETNSYEYDLDTDYNGPLSASLPCKCKRGVSYTPPGWRRRYKYKKILKPKTLIDHLFEL